MTLLRRVLREPVFNGHPGGCPFNTALTVSEKEQRNNGPLGLF